MMLRLTQASLRLGVSRTTVRYATTYFTDDDEWCSVDAGVATIGITEHAQELLGDIVYVELPDVGASFAKAEAFGSVESVKTSSECYAPIDGEILEVNEVRRRGVLFSLALVRSLSLSLLSLMAQSSSIHHARFTQALEDEPEKVNEAAESGGWFIKLKVADESQLEGLLSPEAYAELLENEA